METDLTVQSNSLKEVGLLFNVLSSRVKQSKNPSTGFNINFSLNHCKLSIKISLHLISQTGCL